MKCTSESIVQGRLYTKSLCVCVCVKSISAFDLSGQRRPRFLIVIGGVLLRDTQRERTGWLVGEKKGGEFFQEVEDCGGRDISVVCIVETEEFEPSNPVRCGRKIRVLVCGEQSFYVSSSRSERFRRSCVIARTTANNN